MSKPAPSRPSPDTLEPFAIRPKAAAALLGISERLLWEWTRDHGVPHFRLGNVVLYPVRELKAWVSAQAQTTSNAEAGQALSGSTNQAVAG